MAESDMNKSSWQKPASQHTGGCDEKYRRFDRGTRPRALVADRGWKRRFEEPIPLPRGRQLFTLEDAGTYITKLPKAEHEAAEWVAAMRRWNESPPLLLESMMFCCGGCVVSWDGRTKIPVVEVIAPDGRKSLWVAAVTMAKAVAAVKEVIPTSYVATLAKQRLTITRKSEVLRRGEVRRITL
jgi:hypothetical protein